MIGGRTAAAWLVLLGTSLAQDNKGVSVGQPAKDNFAETERASFEVADGYDVSLFASEAEGIANPIAMRWGPRGRLWVLCSLVYPQIVPAEPPNDKLFILEDRDHDGRADKTTVFADGLDMPTGFALGNGGVYLGEGDDLVFLTDTDGDDRADRRELLFTGFGTGDTHQNINSFTWSPGGELLFCQGLHNFARVETPWGIVRMDEHGVWRLRPKRRQLHAFRGGSGQNPWGIAFGQWGEPFVKGNNTELSELLPVMVHTAHRHSPLDIGATRVKSMICEIVDSPALPADLQGDVLIAGYFAHIVDRLELTTEGSGHRGTLLPPLFRTDHQSFRPVDIQTGPDGALYVADWYNPIIGHYQASLRHPDRDKTHGRIWRVTAHGLPTVAPANLAELPTPELLDRLKFAPLRERERVRITLSNRESKEVLLELTRWVHNLDETDLAYEHHLFEALCLHEWNERVNRPLLVRLLRAEEPLARAYATRVTGRWQDRLDDPLALLERSVADAHPRVRLEAVVSASAIPSPQAAAVAMRALDHPTDRFLETALVQCAHALREHWFPALQDGTLTLAHPHHLAFLLRQSSGNDAATAARTLLASRSIASGTKAYGSLARLLATQGSAEDLDWLLSFGAEANDGTAAVFEALVEGARLRELRPAGETYRSLLRTALDSGPEEVRASALQLAGHWKVHSLMATTESTARNRKLGAPVRVAAVEALEMLASEDANPAELLSALATDDPDEDVRRAALASLSGLDARRAAMLAARRLAAAGAGEDLAPLLVPFLRRRDGDTILADALKEVKLTSETRKRMRAVLGAAGHHSAAMAEIIDSALSKDAVGMPAYDEAFVRTLAAEARSSGNAQRGAEVYRREALSCTSCHVLDGHGREFGPDLSAVGAGLPIELIIEAVMWPKRQVKEGYLSSTLTLRNGDIVSGFVEAEDPQRIVVRDTVSNSEQTVARKDMERREDAGTIMPPGLTANLTRDELRDLVRFLSEQKGRPGAAPASSPAPASPSRARK